MNNDENVFRISGIDETTAEQMLSGHPVETHAELHTLLSSAAQAPSLGNEEEAIRSISIELKAGRRRNRLAPIAIAGMAAVASLSFAGAAAASDVLPSPVQNATAAVVSHVGIDLPAPAKNKAKGAEKKTVVAVSENGTTTTTAVHPGSEACHEARELEGAHGCSAVAKEHAPGQEKKSTTTSAIGVDDSATEDSGDDASNSKSANKSDKSKGHGKGLDKK